MEHSLRIDHILGHKISINKFKRYKIISSTCSDLCYETRGNQSQKRNKKKKFTRRPKNMLEKKKINKSMGQ